MINVISNWVIYGSSLSSLVLAERLGSQGKNVILLNPSGSYGGIFRGLKIGDQIFDGGMTNFEFELFGQPDTNIICYSPDSKSDVGKYVHFVESYISNFIDFHKIPDPYMVYQGSLVPDILISNKFDVLRYLKPEERLSMIKELEIILNQPNNLHPGNKYSADNFLEKTSLDAVSKANHGPTFHNLFIDPFFKKVLGISSSEISGIFHRNGWVPLFYPETLLSQFSSSPQLLKPTSFHYPNSKNFGEFIEKIIQRLDQMSNVKTLKNVKNVNFDFKKRIISADKETFKFEKLAWGGALTEINLPGEIKESSSLSSRASLDIFFLEIDVLGINTFFSVLTDPEPESPFYRVTNQSICSGQLSQIHRVTLECNSKNWDEKNPNNQQILNNSLRRYGIDPASVRQCTHKHFAGALSIPSVENRDSFNSHRAKVYESFPEIYLIGHSSGYMSVTLNDQILQALKIAHLEGDYFNE